MPGLCKGFRRKCVEHTCCNGHDEKGDIISAGKKGVDDLGRWLYDVGRHRNEIRKNIGWRCRAFVSKRSRVATLLNSPSKL